MNPFEQNALDALSQLLRSANVKITNSTLLAKLQRNPHFPSMASLKETLSECKINTIAVRGTIEKLSGLPMPVLAFLSTDGGIFAPIRSVADEHVEWYHTEKGWQRDSLPEFEHKWNGALLLIEPTSDSNEKEYHVKRIKEYFAKMSFAIVGMLFPLFVYFLLWIQLGRFTTHELFCVGSLVSIKLLGAGLSGILVWRSGPLSVGPVLRPDVNITHRFRDTTNLMRSATASPFYLISYPELSLLYFSSTCLAVGIGAVLGVLIYQYIFLLNLPGLVFSLFFIYKQIGTFKKVCVISLVILALVWVELGIMLFLGRAGYTQNSGWPVFVLSSMFVTALYTAIKPFLVAKRERGDLLREFNKMKSSPSHIEGILTRKVQLPPIFEGMKIIRIGNHSAKQVITLVYSPGTIESAALHISLAELFQTRQDICWQIIFRSTGPRDEEVIRAVLECKDGSSVQALDLWFTDIDQSVSKWKKCIGNSTAVYEDSTMSQVLLHSNWCQLAKVSAIPSVFINDAAIPIAYQPYDLPRLLECSAKLVKVQRETSSSTGIKIVTCINNQEDVGYKHVLKASCHFFKLDLITLVHPGKWDSHRHKDSYLKKYLLSLPSQQIVLFTDGYDTILLGGEKDILDRYRSIAPAGEIVVSAEKICYPDPDLAHKYPVTNTPYRFLNSGGIIGRAIDILGVLADIEEMQATLTNDPFLYSNQYLWTRLLLMKGTAMIKLDVHCLLFQTFPTTMETVRRFQSTPSADERKLIVTTELQSILQDFDVNEGENIYNKITRTTPIHLHFNGPVMKSGMLFQPFLSFINKVNQPPGAEM